MEYKWINSNKNSNLIVFFNGWGMDECVIEHLMPENNDVLMFYDYSVLETDFDFNTVYEYPKKYLISWSMGVMTATLFNINYDKKIAINGTLKPISNNFGIPEKVYELTLKGLNENGVKKFVNNMFQEPHKELKIKRNVENLKTELTALKNYKSNSNFIYDKVLISKYDKIIPTKNQTAFWGIEPNLDASHAPFNLFKNWEEFL